MRENMSLENRIQQLEDIQDIQKLQATYGNYVDKGWNDKVVNFDKLPILFTEDLLFLQENVFVRAMLDVKY